MIQHQIEQKLRTELSPSYLKVLNESYMHNVPEGAESHFKVIVVSDDFEGERLLSRHRTINSILADELANHIHALAIHTYSETEWQALDTELVPNSPDCMGVNKG
ncbi:transcriptional regulator BolA [Aliivibrio sp. S3MY1]|uniref:transcriptional regulator BolA n=1 Tax=unclassified Aliivibrio TaxID=2645654 RepID=UPI002379A849|nr:MULTISPECIES: transcriptional regulator BolA [unclassified Aliivibrio]MDD9197325.1 transcriptional regulator BolA [Aliivibrio sp. S3MY1]MDD9200679.1 transcriptional regulator BolA [Aliivibrio sp. S2MY1]